MEKGPTAIERINRARLRPIELSEAQFEHEKKIKRYNPKGYTFMKYNPGNVQESEEEVLQVEKLYRVTTPKENVQQLDLFHVESSF